eukprot:gene16118-17743_t
MKLNLFHIVRPFLLFCLVLQSYGEPISLAFGLGAGAVALIGAGSQAYCRLKECCHERWTSHNISGLERHLNAYVFGQHLALDIIPKSIKGHITDKDPQKPLVLSFHGGTGSGKNFISKIIAEHLYPLGYDSKYVTKILSSHEFPSSHNLDAYKMRLKKMVVDGISKCQNALFVIDELDKMPAGLSDVLKSYLDYNHKVDGFDFRKAIFIFMSNTGHEEMETGTLQHWKTGKKREEISMKMMNKLLKTVAYHSEDGFGKSRLIDHHLVDFFVPFMPMERVHIRKCAKAAMRQRNIFVTERKLDQVADELEYFPTNEKLYSISGCKNVERIVQVLGNLL